MNWKMIYAHHHDFITWEKQDYTIAGLESSGFPVLDATVPGNFELDLMREELLEDLYFSTNTLMAQEWEDVHLCYYTKVMISQKEQFLRFEGIDTYSDIYVNGFLVKSTDNMFLTYDVKAQWEMGENQVVVHIKPAMLEARKDVAPAFCMHQRYNRASLYTRKAPHMYGWDIMPRIVSAGIWKKVTLRENKTDSIRDVYLATLNTVPDSDNPDYGKACLRCYVYVNLSGSFAQSYRIKVEGHLRGFSQTEFFVKEENLWHNTDSFLITLDHCRLWWPGNYGSPALYDVTVTLYCGEEVCDQEHLNLGVRTAELRKTFSFMVR